MKQIIHCPIHTAFTLVRKGKPYVHRFGQTFYDTYVDNTS